MTPLRAASLLAILAAAVAGIALARRRREHVPAAVALSLLSALNFTEVVTGRFALLQLDRAVWLALAAVVPGLAVSVFLSPRRRRPALACVIGSWVLACIALAVLYPLPAQLALQRFYLGASLAGDFVAIVALISWARWARGRANPSSSHAVALGLIVVDLAALLLPFGPWSGSLFTGRWDVVQVLILTVFSVATITQVILWRFSSRSS